MIEGFFHERSIFIYNIQEKKKYIYIYIDLRGCPASLRARRLIPRILKLTTM
jgi:hypothetical protein